MTKRNSTDEIEVTSAMEAAGFDVLDDWMGVLDKGTLVREVYIAMVCAKALHTPSRANIKLARMLHRCAQACIAEDQKQMIEANYAFEPSACGPSARGQEICVETAGKEFGPIVYFLLAYTWNDSLDWADRQLGEPGR